MKTPEQLKGAIRNIAKEKNLSAQEVLQIYMFERIIERISKSAYRDHFILKGGLLISSMVGIAERTTMDMDATIKGMPVDEETIIKAITEILSIDVGDEVQFQINSIKPIREEDTYDNFRVSIQAVYGRMNTPMKIDITTGDEITPREISYPYQFVFQDKSVNVMAYTLETILAEKYETLIRRNISNTRARDFYDLYLLYRLYKDRVDAETLREAVRATAAKRGSLNTLDEYMEITRDIEESDYLKRIWNNYQKENTYAKSVSFDDILGAIKQFNTILFP